MVQFVNGNTVPGWYFTVAASQTDAALGTQGGASGDYLEKVIIVAATTAPGAVTIKDGSTAIISQPAGTATVLPYTNVIPVNAYSKTGAWKITTGANVSVVVTGLFT